MVAVAIGTAVAGVVGAGASVISANKASDTAQQTAANNNALQSQIYNTNTANLAPFEQRGNAAGSSINALLGLNNPTSAPTGLASPSINAGGGVQTSTDAADAAFDAYKSSTEYQSRLTQGQNTVTAALGSKSLLDSGAALKAELNYGQTAASNEFGQYIGNLQGQQQVGLAAAGAQAGVGQSYANAVSTNNNVASNTSSSADLSNAKAINSALGNAVTAFSYNQGLGSSYGGSSGVNTSGYDPSYNYSQGG